MYLVEYHQFDSDQGVIPGPNFFDVVIEAVWDDPEEAELESVLDVPRLVGRIRSVPREFVRPLPRAWNVPHGAVQDTSVKRGPPLLLSFAP